MQHEQSVSTSEKVSRSGAVVTIALLAVVAAILTWAVVVSRDGGTPPATTARSRTEVVSQPVVNSGDYVVVDDVQGPDQLIVHTTRDPLGHNTAPYRVLLSPNTVVHSAPDGATRSVGIYDGFAVGDRFYFVGTTLSSTPGHRIVQAVRVFLGM